MHAFVPPFASNSPQKQHPTRSHHRPQFTSRDLGALATSSAPATMAVMASLSAIVSQAATTLSAPRAQLLREAAPGAGDDAREALPGAVGGGKLAERLPTPALSLTEELAAFLSREAGCKVVRVSQSERASYEVRYWLEPRAILSHLLLQGIHMRRALRFTFRSLLRPS